MALQTLTPARASPFCGYYSLRSLKNNRGANPGFSFRTNTPITLAAPVFRSTRTNDRSALISSLLNQSPPLVPCQVPPWVNRPSEAPVLATSYYTS